MKFAPRLWLPIAETVALKHGRDDPRRRIQTNVVAHTFEEGNDVVEDEGGNHYSDERLLSVSLSFKLHCPLLAMHPCQQDLT